MLATSTPSTRKWTFATPRASSAVAVSVIAADLENDCPAVGVAIVTIGAVLSSTVTDTTALLVVFPAASLAWTLRSLEPTVVIAFSVSQETVHGGEVSIPIVCQAPAPTRCMNATEVTPTASNAVAVRAAGSGRRSLRRSGPSSETVGEVGSAGDESIAKTRSSWSSCVFPLAHGFVS